MEASRGIRCSIFRGTVLVDNNRQETTIFETCFVNAIWGLPAAGGGMKFRSLGGILCYIFRAGLKIRWSWWS